MSDFIDLRHLFQLAEGEEACCAACARGDPCDGDEDEGLGEATTGGTASTGNQPKDNTGALVRHCMVAVSQKLKKKGVGSAREQGRQSRAICQAQLTRQGYLKRSGGKQEEGLPPGKGRYRVTGKGSRRNMKHAMEKDNDAKQKEYERLRMASR